MTQHDTQSQPQLVNILYWGGIFIPSGTQIPSNLIPTLIKLVNGEYKALGIAKKRGQRRLVLSCRVNGEGRILFTTVNRDGQEQLVFLKYFVKHDEYINFLNQKTLLAQLVTKQVNSSCQLFSNEFDLLELDLQSEVALDYKDDNLEHLQPNFVEVDYLNGKFDQFALSMQQQAALEAGKSKDLLAIGAPGSGKSLLLEALVSSSCQQEQSVLILMLTDELKAKFSQYLHTNLAIDQSFITIQTLCEFLTANYPQCFSYQVLPDINQLKTLCHSGNSKIKHLYDRLTNQKTTSKVRNLDFVAYMYEEFKLIIDKNLSQEQYRQLSSQAYFNLENAEDIYTCCMEFAQTKQLSPVGEEYFIDFCINNPEAQKLIKLFKKSKLFAQSANIINYIYNEFKNISHLTSFDDYQNLGDKQSIFFGDYRLKIFNLFNIYKRYLKDNKTIDINIQYLDPQNYVGIKYNVLVIDEAQEWPAVQLQSTIPATTPESRKLITADPQQVTNNVVANTQHLYDLLGPGYANVYLNHCYRCSNEVTNLVNRWLSYSYLVKHSPLMPKNLYAEIDCQSTIAGEVMLYDSKEISLASLCRIKNLSECMIIISDEKDRASAMEVSPWVYDISQVKGLEDQDVILYNFFEGELVRDGVEQIFAFLQSSNSNEAIKKDKQNRQFLEMQSAFNKVLVALTRARESIFILGNSPNVKQLLDVEQSFSSSIKGANLTDVEFSTTKRLSKIAANMATGNIRQVVDAILDSRIDMNLLANYFKENVDIYNQIQKWCAINKELDRFNSLIAKMNSAVSSKNQTHGCNNSSSSSSTLSTVHESQITAVASSSLLDVIHEEEHDAKLSAAESISTDLSLLSQVQNSNIVVLDENDALDLIEQHANHLDEHFIATYRLPNLDEYLEKIFLIFDTHVIKFLITNNLITKNKFSEYLNKRKIFKLIHLSKDISSLITMLIGQSWLSDKDATAIIQVHQIYQQVMFAKVSQLESKNLLIMDNMSNPGCLYWLTATSEGIAILNKIKQSLPIFLPLLTHSLFTPYREDEDKGKTPLFWLIKSKEGKNLLNEFQAEQLAQLFTTKSLTSLIQKGKYKGTTPLFWLTESTEGIRLLQILNSSHLETLLTTKELTIPAEGDYKGITPLFLLTVNGVGRELIYKKVFAGVLETIFSADTLSIQVEVGEHQGKTTLHNLTSTPLGIRILEALSLQKLLLLLNKKSLALPAEVGDDCGETPLFCLSEKSDGINLLNKFNAEQLSSILTAESLAKPLISGLYQGRTPLFHLTSTSSGKNLLNKLDKEQLYALLSRKSLVMYDKVTKMNPLHCLALDLFGLRILNKLDSDQLYSLMSLEALSMQSTDICEGKTPLYLITSSTVGILILQKKFSVEQLFSLLGNKFLSIQVVAGEDHGKTALFNLLYSIEGQNLLDRFNSKQFADLLLANDLSTIVRAKKFKGMTPLSLLAGNTRGRELLYKLNGDQLAQILTVKSVSTVIETELFNGITPLYWLTFVEDGLKILDKLDTEHLFLLLNCDAISRPSTGSTVIANQGKTPLFWLSYYQEGINLLSKLNECQLKTLFTVEALTIEATNGEEKGMTPFSLLKSNPMGTDLLRKADVLDVLSLPVTEPPVAEKVRHHRHRRKP